jgi:HD-like signal output (HDOD) protein
MSGAIQQVRAQELAAAESFVRSALAGGALDLPPLPAIALQAMQLASEDADAAELAKLIQKDIGLAAQIVRVANSSLYARRTPVAALPQAISWLGLAEVRKLALACAVKGKLFANKTFEPILRSVWAESVAVAVFAQEVARARRRSVESAYLCGLLHRAGQAVLLQLLARAPAAKFANLEIEALDYVAAEHEANAAQRLVKAWELSGPVAAVVCHWRGIDAPATQALGKAERLALLEVHIGRVLTALTLSAVDELPPPELCGISAKALQELGLYYDDLGALWSKRNVALQSIEALS